MKSLKMTGFVLLVKRKGERPRGYQCPIKQGQPEQPLAWKMEGQGLEAGEAEEEDEAEEEVGTVQLAHLG
jgi:hypothetical protein